MSSVPLPQSVTGQATSRPHKGLGLLQGATDEMPGGDDTLSHFPGMPSPNRKASRDLESGANKLTTATSGGLVMRAHRASNPSSRSISPHDSNGWPPRPTSGSVPLDIKVVPSAKAGPRLA